MLADSPSCGLFSLRVTRTNPCCARDTNDLREIRGRGRRDRYRNGTLFERRSRTDGSDHRESVGTIQRTQPRRDSERPLPFHHVQPGRHGQQYPAKRIEERLYPDHGERETDERRHRRTKRPEYHQPGNHRTHRDCKRSLLFLVWKRCYRGCHQHHHEKEPR